MKLFAVFLGGRADRCNIELHDVVFTCSENIENSYSDLLSKWFGNPLKLHIDSWVELDYIDGYKIDLLKSKPTNDEKLYFINLGGYNKHKFEELHESKFLIGENKSIIKKRAKDSLLLGYDQVHTDDLYDVDDCIEINKVSDYYIHLKKSNVPQKLLFNNGYLPIPKNEILEFIKNK